MNKYELLFEAQMSLGHSAQIIGPEYFPAFIRGVKEAIKREHAAAEARRIADNAARLARMRKEAV